MRITRRRGLVALTIGAAVAAAVVVAMPTVASGQFGAGPNGTLPAAPKAAAVFTGACHNTRMSYASNDAISAGTSSNSFVTVPGMTVNLNTPGSCAEITFSAYPFAGNVPDPDALIEVRALVDGNVCLPGPVQFSGDDSEDADNFWARSHSYTFVCTFAASHNGHHTATVEWRTVFADTVFMHKPTMIVRHA
jgi:hypothetical protein